MKRTLILLIILFAIPITKGFAQRTFVSNQYIYDLFLMNPADAGSNRNCIKIGGIYQKQWTGTELAPTTQLLSLQAPLPKNTGSGTYIFNDRNGNNSKIGFQQTLSVDVILRENRSGFTSLAFGLSGMVEQASVNMSNFTGGDGAIDPAVGGGKENGVGFNMNTGLILKINQYKIGGSVTNILPNNNPFYEKKDEPELKPYYHGLASSVYKMPGVDLYIEPMVYYRFNSDNNTRLDLNLKLQIPTFSEDLSFWGLVAYRRNMDHKVGKDLGLAFTAGALYKGINLGIEHQFGLTSAQTYYGSYMKLVLGYKICFDKSKAAIPCSAAGLSGIGAGEIKRQKRGFFKR